jgi:hypothetical protein
VIVALKTLVKNKEYANRQEWPGRQIPINLYRTFNLIQPLIRSIVIFALTKRRHCCWITPNAGCVMKTFQNIRVIVFDIWIADSAIWITAWIKKSYEHTYNKIMYGWQSIREVPADIVKLIFDV